MSIITTINSIIAIWQEIRIYRRLKAIKVAFTPKFQVIRNNQTSTLLLNELLPGDTIILEEGMIVPQNGTIHKAEYVQVDESMLTGESDYLIKQKDDELLAGSTIITGRCEYTTDENLKENYINSLSKLSTQVSKQSSKLERSINQLIIFFVSSALFFGAMIYIHSINLGFPASAAVLPLTTAVSLIISQTLIFLFTFTFSIAVYKLSNMGVLVQRATAIETITHLDTLCIDKTGTITQGDLKVLSEKYWNSDAESVSQIFQYLNDKTYGRNRTFDAITQYFAKRKVPSLKVSAFDQVPFTSRTKMARAILKLGKSYSHVIYGAYSSVKKYISPEIESEIASFVSAEEKKGLRIIVGVLSEESSSDKNLAFTTKKVWVLSLKEELNPGIKATLKKFKHLGTEIKIISGDNNTSVLMALKQIGLTSMRSIDLSNEDINKIKIENYDVFTRAKPEDKLKIIRHLQNSGKKVGMVGDGINDILALKTADLSIAMEGGAQATRQVSDFVLIKNDFNTIPQVIYESYNLIKNLQIVNTIFLTKTFFAIFSIIMCVLLQLPFFLLPTSAAIYSFLGTSLPGFVIAFIRKKRKPTTTFWKNILPDALIGAVFATIGFVSITLLFRSAPSINVNTGIVYMLVSFSLGYGLYLLKKHQYINNFRVIIISFLMILICSLIFMYLPTARNYYSINVISLAELLISIFIGIAVFALAGAFSTLTSRIYTHRDLRN
jgi:cation-transporting ATPase E